MKPVLDDRRQVEPGRLQAVGRREQRAGAGAGEHAAPRQRRSERQANGASTSVEMPNRTARKAKSG